MHSLNRLWLVPLALPATFALLAGCAKPTGEPTALVLMKEADRFVGEQIKGKIVQVRSDKSIGGLTPSVWFVAYHDPDATFKVTEVKFGAGQKLEVTRPLRVLELVTGSDTLLDQTKIKLDSDQALKVAAAEPLLKPLKLTAAQLRLESSADGPVWKVRLWAAKLKKPEEDASLGEVIISADTRKVIQANLDVRNVE